MNFLDNMLSTSRSKFIGAILLVLGPRFINNIFEMRLISFVCIDLFTFHDHGVLSQPLFLSICKHLFTKQNIWQLFLCWFTLRVEIAHSKSWAEFVGAAIRIESAIPITPAEIEVYLILIWAYPHVIL